MQTGTARGIIQDLSNYGMWLLHQMASRWQPGSEKQARVSGLDCYGYFRLGECDSCSINGNLIVLTDDEITVIIWKTDQRLWYGPNWLCWETIIPDDVDQSMIHSCRSIECMIWRTIVVYEASDISLSVYLGLLFIGGPKTCNLSRTVIFCHWVNSS